MTTDRNEITTSDEQARPEAATPEQTMGAALDRFARSFESSARRWEFVVYPSLFAFAILASYGFFLIYSLTKDMSTLAQNVDPKMAANMDTMSQSIGDMSSDMAIMRHQITKMVGHIEHMDGSITVLNGSILDMNRSIDLMESHTVDISEKLGTLEPILANMEIMNQSIGRMTLSTGVMSYDVNQMSRPMNFMNWATPWK
jgi:hypothetical protein